MKKFDITVAVEQLTDSELSSAELQLVEFARKSTFRSYAPYSQFSVGAAIRLSNGEIICGTNQENVAFPSGTCAERSACFYAHAQYPDARFEMIAIAARGVDGLPLANPIPPCGACRQSLLQYELLAERDVPVLLIGRDYIYRLPSVRSLLPLAFTSL
ncbi:MAG: cytidine deaminase [Bacteroides sp.]|nr:cytidine deaminase [Bacteroides sp.]MCM1379950.1 cytidine deaminase [Bacteroides sp.]MCM1446295.1 cytidine deaminase [Prevotella sp.]